MRTSRVKSQPIKALSQSSKVIYLTISIIGVLMLANVALSAHVSHLGFKLDQLTSQASRLDQANQQINGEIVAHTSLTDLTNIALSLGFSHDIDFINLDQPSGVALKR